MSNIKGSIGTMLDIPPQSGTYVHAAGVTEDTAITLSSSDLRRVNSVYFDLVNLTQNITIRVKAEVDDSTARTIDTLNWVTADEDGVLIGGFATDVDITITFQSAVTEGAGRNIPYRVL